MVSLTRREVVVLEKSLEMGTKDFYVTHLPQTSRWLRKLSCRDVAFELFDSMQCW